MRMECRTLSIISHHVQGSGQRCLKSDGYTDDHLKITEKNFLKTSSGITQSLQHSSTSVDLCYASESKEALPRNSGLCIPQKQGRVLPQMLLFLFFCIRASSVIMASHLHLWIWLTSIRGFVGVEKNGDQGTLGKYTYMGQRTEQRKQIFLRGGGFSGMVGQERDALM